ncbi:hypothetical protein CKAN_00153900 [Cinnamomum micranthum f. kanehirae]|uniref:DUF659 domain-containing protein n=1 Tax=Cinnamomum micranthum f. kanehirae TaxID=337451 RepID=A0A443N418_9MAGN|nr:hypothetical protein CKAN_00153900 [Cinnamomum micranthum f. kanehirae]
MRKKRGEEWSMSLLLEGAGSSSVSGGGGMLRRMFSKKQTRQPPDWLVSGESPTQQARRLEVVGPIDPTAYRSPSAKQPSIAKALSEKMGYARNRLVRAVGKFFFDGAIAPNKATSPYLKTMLDVATEHGPGIKPPTPYEIGHYCVEEEYKETVDWVNTFKRIWRERGCTLMCDGWTTITRWSLLNFLVYSSLGTVFIRSVDATEYVKDATYLNKLFNEVIEDIGAECVVQIITDSDASMKKAEMILMQQRPNIFWSPCAAHCLDLMIEDIAKGKMIKGVILKAKKITNFIYQSNRLIAMMKKYMDNHELLRPGITRFATHFIALESLYKYRGGLHQLFTSQELLESKWGKKPTPQAKQVVKIVQSKRYWPFVSETLKVLEPLIKVLRLADGDDKPTMGFLYEAVVRAKLAIQANCKYYKAYWKIIDNRWEKQLHHDLHAAENDDVLAQWIEKVEEPVLDHDEQIGDMVQKLTGERPEPMRVAERLYEINLTHQRRRGVNPQEMRDEVDDDEDISLSSTSSSSDVPHDSDGDGGGDGGEIPPHMMETVEHFPSSGNIDSTSGYRRIIPPTESSHAGASGSGYGGGKGSSGGDVGHQQVMYGDYYVLHPHQQLELPHEFYRQHHDYPQ